MQEDSEFKLGSQMGPKLELWVFCFFSFHFLSFFGIANDFFLVFLVDFIIFNLFCRNK